jgi:hypothetical protein
MYNVFFSNIQSVPLLPVQAHHGVILRLGYP